MLVMNEHRKRAKSWYKDLNSSSNMLTIYFFINDRIYSPPMSSFLAQCEVPLSRGFMSRKPILFPDLIEFKDSCTDSTNVSISFMHMSGNKRVLRNTTEKLHLIPHGLFNMTTFETSITIGSENRHMIDNEQEIVISTTTSIG